MYEARTYKPKPRRLSSFSVPSLVCYTGVSTGVLRCTRVSSPRARPYYIARRAFPATIQCQPLPRLDCTSNWRGKELAEGLARSRFHAYVCPSVRSFVRRAAGESFRRQRPTIRPCAVYTWCRRDAIRYTQRKNVRIIRASTKKKISVADETSGEDSHSRSIVSRPSAFRVLITETFDCRQKAPRGRRERSSDRWGGDG